LKLPLQIALGLTLAAVVIGLFRLVMVSAVFKTVESEGSKLTQNLQSHVQEQRQAQAAEAERQRLAEEKRLREVAVQEEQERERERYIRERRAAFDDQYVPPEDCDVPATSKALVECANHKMRSREKFFADYPSEGVTL
jgi:hypothetical protein